MDRDWAPEEFAIAALEVGTLAARLVSDGRIGMVEGKSNANDVVTDLDRASEELLVREITGRRHLDGVLGEEGARIRTRSGYEWVIDPLDGTVNFVYGIPAWCVSVGVRSPAGPVAGAVVAPAMGEAYVAWLGGGAHRISFGVVPAPGALAGSGEHLAVSGASDLSRALIGTGFSYDPGMRASQGAVVAGMLGEVRDVRRMGSAALDLCAVASGRLDGYFEWGLHPWDIAAGVVMVAEAGGVVTVDGDGLVLAASPGIETRLRAALRR